METPRVERVGEVVEIKGAVALDRRQGASDGARDGLVGWRNLADGYCRCDLIGLVVVVESLVETAYRLFNARQGGLSAPNSRQRGCGHSIYRMAFHCIQNPLKLVYSLLVRIRS